VGLEVPYDLGNLPAGCEVGTVTHNGNLYLALDFDHDGDVDQTDYAFLQRCISGEGYADPACAD
jgi:hypothetical protein